jgi:hypothetical protein
MSSDVVAAPPAKPEEWVVVCTSHKAPYSKTFTERYKKDQELARHLGHAVKVNGVAL